jgi:Asp-tRNA(Asn)/Glu-tRNA(Gln) amidotransferase B subunit
MPVTALYRPVGERELELIRESGWRPFPPRLPEQPIFYPVLNEEYDTQFARDWNTRDGGIGYVLRFDLETNYLARFPVQTAGARIHQEYWIPAEELVEFNRHIVGLIEIVSEFRGDRQ